MSDRPNPISDQTSAPASGSAPTTALSHGLAIEYQAFARSFAKGDSAAVLFLVASGAIAEMAIAGGW